MIIERSLTNQIKYKIAGNMSHFCIIKVGGKSIFECFILFFFIKRQVLIGNFYNHKKTISAP